MILAYIGYTCFIRVTASVVQYEDMPCLGTCEQNLQKWNRRSYEVEPTSLWPSPASIQGAGAKLGPLLSQYQREIRRAVGT